MSDKSGEIKSVKLSTLAMLVDVLMECKGITETRDLAKATQRDPSQIRKAKRELVACGRANMPYRQISPPVKYARASLPVSQVGTVHAINTELPKGNTLSSGGVARKSEIQEIPGLNGATIGLVEKLANWIAGDLGTPNLETSRILIAGNVEYHGADKVRQGMLDLEALIASGEKPRNVCKTFATYVKRAMVGEQPQPLKENFVDRRRREAFALIEEMGGSDEQAAH